MTLRERLTIWARLLVLQAAWSYRRMQTCGWLWIAEPIARRQRGQAATLLSRSVVQFNTHSLLAPLLLGAAVGALSRTEPDTEAAKGYLVRWMGTFGALGDMWYWQTLAWHFAWSTIAAYWLGGGLGVLVVAVVWLLAEIAIRIYWFERGLRQPEAIGIAVRRLASPRLRVNVSRIAVLLLAPMAGMAFGQARVTAGTAPDAEFIGLVSAVVAVLLGTRTRFRSVILWLPVAAGLIYGLWSKNLFLPLD